MFGCRIFLSRFNFCFPHLYFQVALTAALWGGIFVAMSKQERKALKMEQRAAEERAAAAAVRGDNGVCGEQVK
jgi:hypothetical protein